MSTITKPKPTFDPHPMFSDENLLPRASGGDADKVGGGGPLSYIPRPAGAGADELSAGGKPLNLRQRSACPEIRIDKSEIQCFHP